ncbi:hypothetical protein K431DRAFT_286361 [Polychaeton citri CBS 116435]|uniref:Cation efflux protein transmembrane domain-containing protein n=1 Tax=Polychaeton citri CBS 116435 TaxID=1314669 RepID=A0A9P4Q3F8_9PEZI|nr:hypothetical protein K431DRAFT_286361 [Polychaeton citri CBS 116435]
MTSDVESQEPLQHTFRIAPPRGFLPLSEDSALSTRGQALSNLLHSRSDKSAADPRNRNAPWRRRSSVGESERTRISGESQRGAIDGSSAIGDHEAYQDDSVGTRHRASFSRRLTAVAGWGGGDNDGRRFSNAASVLMTPQMRSQRLIGNSNPRYRWEKYWKSEHELKKIKDKCVRKYYERNNYLIQHYMYIDRLLDSSLPHNLIQEYGQSPTIERVAATEFDFTAGDDVEQQVPSTITEEEAYEGRSGAYETSNVDPMSGSASPGSGGGMNGNSNGPRVKRTPRDLYRIKEDETTPLITRTDAEGEEEAVMPPDLELEEEANSQSRIVTIAIYINLVANTVLLIMKIIAAVMTSSVSVLASLVDAALDFLSTAIVWTTTRLISRNDQYAYPIGRRRLEPIGVLVFSVIMITSFFQVALEGFNHLTSPDHTIVQLTIPAIVIMAATVVIKFLCWLWCRLIPNSSVQALAQDAMTDVVFNIFSIIFPLVGFYARIWWLDPLGGILLSFYVIINWAQTSSTHIRNLTGAAASADERNILLYLTMRFAKTVRKIQGLQAYHSGDKLNVEVDIVLDEGTSLRDSHDLGESLQYVLESVPNVDRAFVHMDYLDYNLPSHLQQD